MRADWLEDLLAVLECGSIQAAAAQRCVTQPAFSRRLKAIEDEIGTELIDRSVKPARLKASIAERGQTMRELAFGLRSFVNELRQEGSEARKRVVIACQHAITTAVMPDLVKRLAARTDLSLRVRSDNYDECIAMLMTRRADVCFVYRSDIVPLPAGDDVLEERFLAAEHLIPVFQTEGLDRLNAHYRAGTLPIVAYPMDVFLGKVAMHAIYPRLQGMLELQKVAESALTPAALQFARAGVGVAWIPWALARADIESGALTDLSGVLPRCPLSLVALRWLKETRSTAAAVWDAVNVTGGEYSIAR